MDILQWSKRTKKNDKISFISLQGALEYQTIEPSKKRSPSLAKYNKNFSHYSYSINVYDILHTLKKGFLMKKNILLVQSLLILPLISSSFIFSMDPEKTEKTYATAVKGTPLGQQNQQNPLKQSGTTKKRKKKSSKQQPQATAATITDNAKIKDDAIAPIEKQETLTIQQNVDQQPLAVTLDDEHGVKAEEEIAAQQNKEYFSDEDAINAKQDLELAKSLISETDYLELLSAIRSLGTNPVVKAEVQEEPVALVDTSTIKITVSEDLENSILFPSAYKALALSYQIRYALSTNRTLVLDLLQKDTFESNNAAHTEIFNKALEECATNKDIDSLANILNLCQTKEKYKQLQSAINHVAPAFNFLCDKYQAQITESNTILKDCNQQNAIQINKEAAHLKEEIIRLLDQHRKTTTEIANRLEAKVKEEQQKTKELQLLIANVSALNAKIKPHENNLLFAFPLDVPKNSVKEIEESTHIYVRRWLSNTNNIPQAKGAILQIDNKK